MTPRYYFDRELLDGLLRYRMRPYLADMDRGTPMGKLADISDRIARKKAAHDAKADEWARRLDELDGREAPAFAVGDEIIAERETDLSEMEADMRKLSNLPFGAGAVLPKPAAESPPPVDAAIAPAPAPAIHHDTGDPMK